MTIAEIHQIAPLQQAIDEIHKHFAAAIDSDNKAFSHRVRAGQKLNSLRKRIEAGEAGIDVRWWEWYEEHFVRSRRDAERVMVLASSDDPAAAHEAEKAANREAVRAHRERNKTTENEDSPTYVSRSDDAPADSGNAVDPEASAELRGGGEPPAIQDRSPFADRLVTRALELVAIMNERQIAEFFAKLEEEYSWRPSEG